MLTTIRRFLQLRRICVRLTVPAAYRNISGSSKPVLEPKKLENDENSDESTSQSSLPWYLRDDAASPLAETAQIDIPQVPESAPLTVSDFIDVLAKEYGLDNLALFDLTQLDDDHDFSTENQPARYILIGSGKSEKHIMKAASQLRLHIKHNHDHLPTIEGMVTGGTSPRARRRMLRRSRKGPLATDNDYGRAPNSWVMCDTGIDGIQVHMLTPDRRHELNLESLWCAKEDAWRYERQQEIPDYSDNIFSGVRHFHTMGPFYQKQPYQILLNSSPSITEGELKKLMSEFDSHGNPGARFDFYNTVHLLRPRLVLLQSLSEMLMSAKKPKVEAVVAFMKVLMDSPELRPSEKTPHTMNEQVEARLERLLAFVADLYRYSGEQLQLSGHPELIPLLWGLTTVDLAPQIGSRTIDEAIHTTDTTLPQENPSPSIHIASNKNRDIHDLIAHYNEVNSLVPTIWFKELMLFTYGNAGKWDRFWKAFDIHFNLLQDQDHQGLTKWLRLAVYLDLRSDKTAMAIFLNRYWSRSFPSFVTELQNQKFEDHEKEVFKTTIRSILLKVDTSMSTSHQEVLQTIESL